MSKVVTVTGSGQITLPAEYRQRLGIKTGDRVVVSESASGEIVVKPRLMTAAEMAGMFPLLPGVVADEDFGNLIREAMDDAADRIVAAMEDSAR
jgi:AbrB family looped-hinge helix DNA binding protein